MLELAHPRPHDGGDAVAGEAFRSEVAMLVDRAEHALPRLQPSESGPGFKRPACCGHVAPWDYDLLGGVLARLGGHQSDHDAALVHGDEAGAITGGNQSSSTNSHRRSAPAQPTVRRAPSRTSMGLLGLSRSTMSRKSTASKGFALRTISVGALVRLIPAQVLAMTRCFRSKR